MIHIESQWIVALLVSTALAAAPLKLGQETPVGDPAFVNAALTQQAASVASNGRDYLVLWNDARGAAGSQLDLWAGRVDASGHPVEPSGHKVVANAVGKLLWTGTSYVLLYSVGGPSFEQFLDENGYPTSPPIHLDLGGPALAAGTNGSNILSVDISGALFLINFDGSVFRNHVGHPLAGVSDVAALPGGDYFFAAIENDCQTTQGCVQRIALEQADRVTANVTSHALANVSSGTWISGAATDDGRMLVAWNDPADQLSLRYEIVDATGRVLAGPALLPNSRPFNSLSVGFDGRDFVVAVADQSWRIAANGQVLDHGTADAGPLLFAHSASGVLQARTAPVNASDTDALIRVAPSFAQLGTAPERSVATSSRRQQEPRLAASAAGFVAWFENNASLMVQPLGGAVTHIADVAPWNSYVPPALAVARGGDGYLVVWQDVVGDQFVFRAKRLALDGTPLDAAPIAFAGAGDVQFDVSHALSIAFDGTNFLVVWPGLSGAVHGARIAQSGTLLDDTPLVIAPADGHLSTTPRVVWTGKDYVVAWLDALFCGCLISPPPPPRIRVLATRVGRDGQPLDIQPTVVWDQSSVASSLALTTNGDGATLVWTGAGCVYVAALRADGTPAREPSALTCHTTPPAFVDSFDDAGVAWSGSEYVALWNDPVGRVIHAERLDETLAPIDDFDVSPVGSGAQQPDVAATATGVAIAYVRYAPESQFGGAPRIFVRALERLVPAQRRRAAR
jgi:hypothetical protein